MKYQKIKKKSKKNTKKNTKNNTNNNKNNSKNNSKNNNTQNKLKKFGLKYLNGGDSLNNLLNNPDINEDKIKEYLEKFENIFKGILLLHNEGIYHLDIKPQNIVYDGKQMRLIDFGGSIVIDVSNPKISLLKSLNLISTYGSFTALYCPPEMVFFGCNIDKLDKFIKNLPISIKENFNINNVKRKPPHKSVLNESILYDIGSFDIWCLGMTLLDIYNIIMQNEKMTNKELKENLMLLIYELLNKNYHLRPNAQKALNLYKTFLSKIKSKS